MPPQVRIRTKLKAAKVSKLEVQLLSADKPTLADATNRPGPAKSLFDPFVDAQAFPVALMTCGTPIK